MRKFGDSPHKGGGMKAQMQIFVRYEHLGVEFTFNTLSWDDNKSLISIIKVFSINNPI